MKPKIDLQKTLDLKNKIELRKNNQKNIEKLIKRKKINLIPAEMVKAQKRRRTMVNSVVALIAVAGFLGGIYIGLDRETERMRLENNKMAKQISELEDIKEQQDFLNVIDKKIDEKQKVLEEIEKGNISLMTLFVLLEKNIPKDIGFLNVIVDQDGNIVVNGSAGSDISVAELVHNLKSESMFDDVFISNISAQSENGAGGYTFSLLCNFGRE